MSDLIGRTIGQYQIIEQIGQGGMATVFKAYQPSIDRYVALKILPSQFAQDPNFVKRFQHEAKAIAALEHPHILPVHDFGTAEGRPYMVMRYVEGGTLAKLMGQAMPYERIAQFVGNIARALDYAHQQGVVHRDIKPSNILIDKHGEVLLTDFGIAKMIEGSSATQLTSAGSILGTPAYMAPEQAEAKKIDGRSDIYSLGVVLYELLTGQPPYQAETPLAVVLMHLNEPLAPPRTVKSDIPEPLERVVLKAMAKDPSQRFQTAGEMEQALKQALKEIESTSITADIPVPAPRTEEIPKAVPQYPSKSGRSMMGPLLIGGGILALLLCVVGGGLAIWAMMTSQDEQVVEATPSPGGHIQATIAVVQEATPTLTSEETSPTATPIPSPTPVTESSSNDIIFSLPELDGEILFEESFDTNRHDWYTGEEEDEYGQSKAEIVDGRYRLSQQATQSVTWWSTLDEMVFDDFVLSIEAIPVEHNAPFAYGLVFRNNFDGNLYMFEIDSDGSFFVNLFEDGEWTTLVDYTEMLAIKRDGPNQLVVEAIGPSLSFFINGEEAITIEDDTVERGSIGVVLELYEEGNSATVDFDNLVVYEISGEEVADEGQDLLFAEYFDSDANGWATGEFEDDYSQNEVIIEDGRYTLNVTAKPDQEPFVEKKLPNQEFTDFILILEATPYDTAEHYSYGISFRLNPDGHGYTFEIGNDGLYAVKLYDGEWTMLKDWSSTEAIAIGQINELMVIAEGDALTFFVNGEELTTLEDNTVSTGKIGLVVDIYEAGESATVDFDNLVIRPVDSR